MNTKKTLYDIISGPGKDLLFDACKYAHSNEVSVPVKFSVVTGYTQPEGHPGRMSVTMEIANIKINTISHEDGSGNSFNLEGHCLLDSKRVAGETKKGLVSLKFRAYYNAQTRKGTISFDR